MGRWNGKTTDRGLGHEHVKDKKRLKATMPEGEPCWRCGQPMYSWQELDRDHVIDRTMGGAGGPAVLAHASCNRSAGAIMGNKLRGFTIASAGPKGTFVKCQTCGRPYTRAARPCEICGAHYHPSYADQRTCGRACGVQLRKRNHGTAGRPPLQRPACRVCGKPCKDLGRTYCSQACAALTLSDGKRGKFTTVAYYTCRYCGQTRVAKATAQAREVCPERVCQLGRLQANNLRVRGGLTQAEADERVSRIVKATTTANRWMQSRIW